MKLLLLVSLVAGALAGDVLGPYGGGAYGAGGVGGVGGVGVGGGGFGVGGGGGGAAVGGFGGVATGGAEAAKAKVFDGYRDWAQNANNAQNWDQKAQNHGRTNTAYADDANKANQWRQATGSDYGNRASNWDSNNNAASRAADQAAANSWDANRWGERNDANKAVKDQLWAQGNQWYQGRRNNDDIDYAYDKSFNLRDGEKGGFEAAESDRAWAKDDLADRAASYDRNTDKAAAWASAADAQKADRKSAASQNAADSGSSWDKFARSSANAASADGWNKDWQQKLDESQGANRLWNDARKTANDVWKDQNTADGYYKRNAGAAGKKYADYDDSVYGYGLAGTGGYAAKPFYGNGDNGYAKAGAAQDAAAAWDAASKDGLRHADAAVTEDSTKASFSRDRWLQDRNTGFDRNQKAAADDKGFSDWSKQNAWAANKADAASAAAANQWNKDQSQQQFNEDVWAKEAERKAASDKGKDSKVYKKWFNDKVRGGDNWERLKYDRDQADDAFGFDTATKKDWGSAANANAWNEKYDAAANDASAARSNAAARQAANSDWKKDAAGWQNANAAAADQDANNRRGFNNADWKQEQGQAATDARAQNAQAWDRDAGRAGINTGAVEVGGAGRGALAGAVGVNGGGVGVGGLGGLGGYGGYGNGYGAGYGGYGNGYGNGYGDGYGNGYGNYGGYPGYGSNKGGYY